LFGSV